MTNASRPPSSAGQKCIRDLERLGWPVNELKFGRTGSLPARREDNPAAERFERLAKSTDHEIAAYYQRRAAEAAAASAGNPETDASVAKATAVMEKYADEIRGIGYPVDKTVVTAVAKDRKVLFEFETGFEATVQARVDLARAERIEKSTSDREVAKVYRERAARIREQLNEQGVRA